LAGRYPPCLCRTVGRGAGHEEQDHHQARGRPKPGSCGAHRQVFRVSTITVVAFTTATARDPGSRANSRTASADMSDTTRCGPDWMSTCAMTPSTCTRVTRPTKRLRAL